MSIIGLKRVFFHEVWMKTADALTSSGFGEIQVACCASVANGDRTVIVFFFFEAFYTFLGRTRDTNQTAAHLSQFRP